MQHIGIGQPGGQGRSGNLSRERGQGAGQGIRRKIVPTEVGVERLLGSPGPQPRQQPMPHANDLGEEIVLRREVGVEGAAREAGRQHDVVDVGSGMATQPEETGGVLYDLGSATGLSGRALRHDMSIIISYDDRHIMLSAHAVDCAALVAASRSARLKTSTNADGGWAPETAYFRLTMKQGTPLMPRRLA